MSSDMGTLELTGRRYQEMLSAFDIAVASDIRTTAIPVIQQLPAVLPEGESLHAFVQARMTIPRKDKVVLVATDSRLLAYRDGDGALVFDAPRDQLDTDFVPDFLWGTRLTVQGSAGTAVFKQLLPGPQADRIFVLAGGVDQRPHRLDLLVNGEASDPGHAPLAAMWQLALYRDRLIDHEGRHLPFVGGTVSAMCDSAGNIAVTRGRDLAEKGIGTLLLGPIGLFGMGNARHREVDNRELYLLVEGPGWAYTQEFVPESGGPLRQFAQTINVVARQLYDSVAEQPREAASDPVARLRELASLRDEGILTNEEFAAQKARVLEQM